MRKFGIAEYKKYILKKRFNFKAHITISNLMTRLLFTIVDVILNRVKYFSTKSTYTF